MGNFLSGLVKDAILAAARHFMGGIGAAAMAHGFITGADETKWLGAFSTFAALSWSMWDKYSKAQQIAQAKALMAPQP